MTAGKISDEELRLVRKVMDAAIAVSRARGALDAADHELTMYRMERAEPDEALRIAREYAERRGFNKTVKRIDDAAQTPDPGPRMTPKTAGEIAAQLGEDERGALVQVVAVRLVSPRSHIPSALQQHGLVVPVWRRGPTMESGYEATDLGRAVAQELQKRG